MTSVAGPVGAALWRIRAPGRAFVGLSCFPCMFHAVGIVMSLPSFPSLPLRTPDQPAPTSGAADGWLFACAMGHVRYLRGPLPRREHPSPSPPVTKNIHPPSRCGGPCQLCPFRPVRSLPPAVPGATGGFISFFPPRLPARRNDKPPAIAPGKKRGLQAVGDGQEEAKERTAGDRGFADS